MSVSGIGPLGRMMVTTFGLGMLRPAPGTWGSLPPVLIAGAFLALPAERWSGGTLVAYHLVLLVIVGVFSASCLAWGNEAEATFGKKDPGSVCADETAGMCLTLVAPPLAHLRTIVDVGVYLLLAFVCFRIADIVKAPPARGLQRHPAGVGILLDDLVAGLQALVAVQVAARVLL